MERAYRIAACAVLALVGAASLAGAPGSEPDSAGRTAPSTPGPAPSAPAPAPERAQPPDPAQADPPVCREALAARPGDELRALRLAEEDRWHAARSASRHGKKLMADSVEQGDTPAQRRRVDEIARWSDAYRQALREARAICGCRERRGDPYREDCDRLFWRFRGALGPPPRVEPEPDGPQI